jgi:putative Mn2+ efflux pump MntP
MLASLTLGLTAVGLSGDAFAASVARGAVKRRIAPLEAVQNGLVFGGVEGLMCLAGWLLAFTFAGFVTALDHWIALVLLSVIGGKMILDSFEAEDAGEDAGDATGATGARRPQTPITTLITAVGTSIDSAAVGIALSLSGVSVVIALVVGLVSAAISTIGFLIGPMVGAALGKRAELLGGLILVGIGLSIWLSHVVFA